jgi:Fibronectin type III domain
LLVCHFISVPAGAPLNFTAIGLGPHSVQLRWDAPAKQHRNGDIVLYEVLYHDRANPADDLATNSTDNSMIISGLEPTTNYIFQIRAYTAKGPGPWSNQLPFRTFASQRKYMHSKTHSTNESCYKLV